jgi:signal transduction histidine kinase
MMVLAPSPFATALPSWRAALLALALLAPLNLPFSIPSVARTKVFGWSSVSDRRMVGSDGPVIARTTRAAREAGLRPGDRVLAIDGERADDASIARRRDAARAGEQLRLSIDRHGQELEVVVPVERGSGSYAGFLDFVIALALACWATGIAVVAWRGATYPPLLLGAALLLIPPSLFPGGVPGAGPVLASARLAWQTLCVAEAFFLPALLLHHAWLAAGPARGRRRPGRWLALYAVLLLALAVMTHGFTDPLVAVHAGWERGLRATLSALLGAGAVGAAALALRRRRDAAMSVRVLLLATGTVSLATAASVACFNWLPRWSGTDVVADVESLTLFLLPCMVAFHLFMPTVTEEEEWKQQRWLATSASVAVTVAYALAICGAVSVVLHTTGRELDGVEWLLFAAIFGSTLALWAPLRYVREMVDRRLLAHWVRQERRARSFGDRVATILEPARIAEAVAEELPALLDVASAELIFVRETAEAWGVEHRAQLTIRDGVEVAREFAVSASRGGTLALPVLMPDGALIAALRVVPRSDSPTLSDLDREVVRTVVQGVASALGNARSYLRLHRTQQELGEAEQIAAIGAMASGLAHEIKNPLASLQMGLFLLERDGAHPGKIQRIRSDVSRIDDLVVGLRRYADGLATETAERVDLREIAGACVDDVRPRAEDRRARIVERYPDVPVLACGSPEQFRLVIRNLLGNAIDSLREDGTIVIEVSVGDAGIRLTVTDDGEGIPFEMRDRVFDLHFSTKPGGSGLGLTLARREISRLGGTIALEPGAGRGARLVVTLPRLQDATRGRGVARTVDIDGGSPSTPPTVS